MQPLSVGLGIGNDGAAASGHPNFIYFGPELQFGHVVGDRIGKQAHTLKLKLNPMPTPNVTRADTLIVTLNLPRCSFLSTR